MLFLDISLIVFFSTNHREVQAAMQMSLSWEESLSLVMNPHPAPLSACLVICSVPRVLELATPFPGHVLAFGPLSASRLFVERTSTNMLD